MHCDYCLKALSSEYKRKCETCTSIICRNCISFLYKNSQSLCPICKKSKVPPKETKEMSPRPHQALKNSEDQIKHLIRNTEDDLIKIKKLSNYSKCEKILKIGPNHLKSGQDIKKSLKKFQKLELFSFNQQKISENLALKYQIDLQQIISTLGRFAVPRELKIIKRKDPKCLEGQNGLLWLGDILNFNWITTGSLIQKIKLLSERPMHLIAIGMGNSIGLNTGICYFCLRIYEDNRGIYSESFLKTDESKDARLTIEIELKHPVMLVNGEIYSFYYEYSGPTFYCFEKNMESIWSDENYLVQHSDEANLTPMIYMKYKIN